jgi:hypothetical protein
LPTFEDRKTIDAGHHAHHSAKIDGQLRIGAKSVLKAPKRK